MTATLFALPWIAALSFAAQGIDSIPPHHGPRTVAIDERIAQDAGIRIGDTLVLAPTPGGSGDTVIVSALVRRSRDPSEVAKGAYRIRVHLDELQRLVAYGDRVERFAVATRSAGGTDTARRAIDEAAFGFRAYSSHEIAVETSTTFLVVSRFHRAIGVITIVASAVFLLCIMLLKVDERRRDVAALRLMGISGRTIVRSVVLESALIATLGSVAGVGLGAAVSAFVNWHYQRVYRTPLTFSLITGDIVTIAVALSLGLGLGAGWLAAQRLVRRPPLSLFGR
ncbi:MAG TPA: FtsX-like permease family protein [Casimicrobiaceae bacterium]